MDTSYEHVRELYRAPLMELIEQAHEAQRQWRAVADIQRCALLSIKTGGCPEDCSYCPQSAHHPAGVRCKPLLSLDQVREAALQAKQDGATRFCMGGAWRSAPAGDAFERVLEMIRIVKSCGLEACVTLGMLDLEQAKKLKAAGLDSYNHNIDTSREFYGNIVTTRTYDDRLRTLQIVREAGISVCCGGIIGLGESATDRCHFLSTLASLQPQPESVSLNMLVPVKGTPLEFAEPVKSVELIRVIAIARILMPRSRVRLSAGRNSMSIEAQLLAFFAGADSLFIGEKLLTTPNALADEDQRLMAEVKA